MNNLWLYNEIQKVPSAAKREIKGGRMSGKTDINPMWRIKTLTQQFGPCGIGWKYTIEKQWVEHGANGVIAAFVNINLYFKTADGWSDAIPGTGGNMFIAKEAAGLYTSDECYKMALTDAISVACKALGMGADVYWDQDASKCDKGNTGEDKPSKYVPPQRPAPTQTPPQPQKATVAMIAELAKKKKLDGETMKTLIQEQFGKSSSKDLTQAEIDKLWKYLNDT